MGIMFKFIVIDQLVIFIEIVVIGVFIITMMEMIYERLMKR